MLRYLEADKFQGTMLQKEQKKEKVFLVISQTITSWVDDFAEVLLEMQVAEEMLTMQVAAAALMQEQEYGMVKETLISVVVLDGLLLGTLIFLQHFQRTFLREVAEVVIPFPQQTEMQP